MLTYYSFGKRNYDLVPVPISTRSGWEFQLVLSGIAYPTFRTEMDQKQPRQGPVLWVFPQAHLHGWTGEGESEVLVFHFTEVPQVLKDHLFQESSFCMKDWELRTFIRLRERMEAYSGKGRDYQVLLERVVLSELTLWILDREDFKLPSQLDRGESKVREAMGWMDAHLSSGVGVVEMAEAVGLSVGYLRRLFHRTTGKSPQSWLNEFRLEKLDHLKRQGNLSQLAMAHACGFRSVQALHQFYRKFRSGTLGS